MSEFKKLQAEIAELQKRAEAARRAERTSAIKTINELIATFDIAVSELSLPKPAASAGGKRGRRGATSAKGNKRPGRPAGAGRKPHPNAGKKVPPKFADGKGNTWAGRGQKPKWLADALAAGATLDQFRIAQ
jgi:DNA-binding protein H-NS